MPACKTLSQALLGVFCAILFASSLEGGGVMRNLAIRGAMIGASDGAAPVAPGVNFYLEDVPAGTVLLANTGKVTSASAPVVVDWGDGTSDTIEYSRSMKIPGHTYTEAGDYVINLSGDTLTGFSAYSASTYPIFTTTLKQGFGCLKRFSVDGGYSVEVGTYTFYNHPLTPYFEIPDGVTKLGTNSFRGTGIERVVVPGSVTSMSAGSTGGVFRDCHCRVDLYGHVGRTSSSGSVNYPYLFGSGDVHCYAETLNDYEFYNLTGMTNKIIVEGTVKKIGRDCFSGCSTEIFLYGHTGTRYTTAGSMFGASTVYCRMDSLDQGEFYNVKGGFSIVFDNDSLTEISNSCFSGCTDARFGSMVLPPGLRTISSYAFANCRGLTSVVIPSGVTYIGSESFSGCTNLADVSILDGLKNIGSRAFMGCTAITSLTIPDSVTNIGFVAFASCTALSRVKLPAPTGSRYLLAHDLFNGCTALEGIDIPSNVSLIDYDCFSGCSSMAYVISRADVPPRAERAIGADRFPFEGVDKSIPVYVPASSIQLYQQADGWSEFTNFQPLS